MLPLVSAIIPTYNRADLLRRALESVLAQEYRPVEAVVVDDGSTDCTAETIEEYRRRMVEGGIELVCARQSNGRAPRARNVGMKLAKGSFFAFLDSDDLWRPGFVSTLRSLLERYPRVGLAFSGIAVIDGEDRVWKSRDSGLDGRERCGVLEKPFDLIMRHMPLQTSGVMVRRSVIEDVGDFDLGVPVVEDWDLWYRIAKKHDFAYTLEELACNRSHPDNLPKFDCVALASSLRMNLKHLPDVEDEETRWILVDRIQRQLTLLQEQVLREGKPEEEYESLLKHELAPRTARFMLGGLVASAPGWVGRSYGRMIRVIGDYLRGADVRACAN